MSIATSERPAEAKPVPSHLDVLTRGKTTPLYIVCSPRRGVGKTLLSRLLIEFHKLDDRPVAAFDLAKEGPQLADFIPDRTTIVDINDTAGQMAFFDSLIFDNNTIRIIDLGHENFRDFFIIVQKIGFFEEVRRHAIQPLLLFMADSDPKSAKAYSILQRWFADVPLLPVRNRAVTKGALDRAAFPIAGAVPVSPEIPALGPSLNALVEQQAFSFAQFWSRALERFPARLDSELRHFMERVFLQFRQIETSLGYEDNFGRREAEDRLQREIAERDSRIARLQDDLAQARGKSAQLSVEAAASMDQIALLQGELMQAKQIAQESSVEADARIEQIRKEADERIARTQAESDERLARARAEIEGTFTRLEAELVQARERAEQAEAKAATEIELITREADERVNSVDRNSHGLIDQVVRLEAELVNAKQRAERAELWLSRIRDQIEGDLIPSFTAMIETKTARLHRKS